MNILDNIKSLLFCFHTFGVRRTIDVLESEKPARIRGSRAYRGRLTPKVYKQKKKALTYSFNRLLKISLSLRYRALDPVFGQNRILIPALIPFIRLTWIFQNPLYRGVFSKSVLYMHLILHIAFCNFPVSIQA